MMARYLAEVRMIEKFFDGFEVQYVPRLDNHDADHLAWIASSWAPTPSDVIVEKLSKPSIKPEESTSEAVGTDLVVIIEATLQPMYDWMYHLIDGILYRQGTNDMMMRYISREEGVQLLQDIHNSVCRSHSSWCSIIGKAFRQGFYWPTAEDDAMEVVTKCKDCQFFQKQTSKNANPLWPIDLS
jgi:hypothetical protein